MADITNIDLSKYRLSRASDMLSAAKRAMDAEDYTTANNRAYYCIFHAMRAVLALEGIDFKKHSAVISRFSQNYLMNNVFPRTYGKLINNASIIRNRSDYQDFYICSIEDTKMLLSGAEDFLSAVQSYLEPHFAP